MRERTLITMINGYGQYIIFWLFIRSPVFTRASKVTELNFY